MCLLHLPIFDGRCRVIDYLGCVDTLSEVQPLNDDGSFINSIVPEADRAKGTRITIYRPEASVWHRYVYTPDEQFNGCQQLPGFCTILCPPLREFEFTCAHF